jgi:putative SOS response-associated peptidase YedK
MCGRYQLRDPKAVGALVFKTFKVVMEAAPRYNVAPSQTMPVIARNEDGSARAGSMRWGLVPFWEKSEKPKIAPINARSEDALSKPMFRQSLQKRRCAVPADGFYEWQWTEGAAKIPYSIQLRGGHPFFFAGIFENATETRPETYAILTTRPNDLMNVIHNRMPVILDANSAKEWVAAGELTKERLEDFAMPYPDENMTAFIVSRLVNNPRNDTPEILASDQPN